MKEHPLISIIVPVYNVDKYLRKCLDSIVCQTYSNLEIILVDDGSSDKSGAICDEYSIKDNRIRVIHQDNLGAAAAKNSGLKSATGDLIAFVDADDWIDKSMYQMMYERLVEDKSEIVSCGVNWISEAGTTIREESFSDRCLSGEESLEQLLRRQAIKEQVWDKLYKKEVLSDIYFVKEKKIDDVFWTYRVLGNSNRVSIISSALYYYVQRNSSVMGLGYKTYWIHALEAKKIRCEYIKERFFGLLGLAYYEYLSSCMYHLQMALITHQNKDEIQKVLSYAEYKKEEKTKINASRKNKIWISLFLCCPVLTCRIRNCFRIGV